MDALTLVVVLAAALLHAGWNALVKGGGDVLVRMALVQAAAAACAAPVLLVVPPPARSSWAFVAGSVAIHQAYFAFLVAAYRRGDLSQVYPIARGSAPALVAVGAYVLAGEVLDVAGVVAVAVISAAIMSLALGRGGGQNPRAVVFALATGATIAGYSLCDGIGVRRAGAATGYIAWLFVLEGIPLIAVALVRRWGSVRTAVRAVGRTAGPGGAAAFLAYGAVIWAMDRAPLTYVSALREVSVVIAALIGARVLREPFGARRIGAATAIVVAAGVLQLGGTGA